MSQTLFWTSAFALFVIAAALSFVFGRVAQKTGILDHPDGDRKTQVRPVARLGGVAIAAALLLSVGVLTLLDRPLPIPDGSEWLIAAFIAIAFVLGLWDDLGSPRTRIKLGILLVACLAISGAGLHADALPSPFGQLTLPFLLMIGSAAWLLVFINAVNFMDGSDGLAIGTLAIMVAGLAIAGTQHGDFAASLAWFALLGALAGFLIHNLRGTLYAGDAGSLGLGALYAALGLSSGLQVWTVATIALPFLMDVLLTLIWRAKHGRSWLQPHRDHAYQRLIDGGWSHREAAVLYWTLTGACTIAAIIAAEAGGDLPFAMFWALTGVSIVLWRVNRKATA